MFYKNNGNVGIETMKRMEFEKTQELLKEYGIPFCKSHLVFSKKDAISFAKKIGYPVALKTADPEVLHRTEVSGVKTDIKDGKELGQAWGNMIGALEAPFLVQKQVSGVELVIGMKRDEQFGPVIMFGLGGIFVEILKDIVFRVAPVSKKEALKMMSEIKGRKALASFRGKETVNMEKVASIITALSKLCLKRDDIQEIDFNPVFADSKIAVVVDAKIMIKEGVKRVGKGQASTSGNIGSGTFDPKSVAVIGATDRPKSVGFGICKNLLEGKKQRKIYFVNPNRGEVFKKKTFAKITDIKGGVDLAVIAVPAKVVLEVVKQAAEKKVKAVIVISAGFAETGERGRELQEGLVKICIENNISLVGPNCLGIIRPSAHFNATFAPATPKKGSVGFISQSGALIDSVIDAGPQENYGFSSIVSYGNEAGLDVSDFLIWLGNDAETAVIALYIEGIKDGRKFIKALKQATNKKPVIVLKAGKTKKGEQAAGSHTAALAGKREIYSAVFKQAGAFEVNTLTQLFDAAKALAWQTRFKGKIGILTNGGGAGVLAADYIEQAELELSDSCANPMDIIGDAGADRYKAGIEAMLGQKDINGLIVVQTMQIMTEPKKNAKIIINAQKKWPKKPIIACFMGEKLTQPGIDLLEKANIPNYPDPFRAVLALKSLSK